MTAAEEPAPGPAKHWPRLRVDQPLVAEALELYVKKASKDLADSKPWISQPNNLISVVAIFISVLGVVYGFYKDHVDSVDKNLQALSATVSDLTKLDTDLDHRDLLTASNWPHDTGADRQLRDHWTVWHVAEHRDAGCR